VPAPKEILELIERFDQHVDDYRNGKYNETQLRRDYPDPFLKALGWDVDNTEGRAEAYRVIERLVRPDQGLSHLPSRSLACSCVRWRPLQISSRPRQIFSSA